MSLEFKWIAAHNFSKYLYCRLWLQHKSTILYVCQKSFLILHLTCLITELLRADHSNDNKRGGVCMYFKEHLPNLRRDDLCNLPECLVTEIRMGKKKFFFTCLYKSPSQSSDEFDTFCSNFNLFLSNINDLNPASSIVIGDFNARSSKWRSSDKETFEGCAIHSLTTSVGYTQFIDQPNHTINNSSSCIDLVFISNPNIICNLGVKLFLFNKCHYNSIFGELNLMVHLPPTSNR